MNALLSLFTLTLIVFLAGGCSAPGAPAAPGLPAAPGAPAAPGDMMSPPVTCSLATRALKVGERAPSGDGCNWCECRAGGVSECTHRTCPAAGGCTYAGAMHAYGARFPSSNGCNECVCAASGLACTRRPCPSGTVVEEGAILLGGLTEPCGGLPDLTGAQVLSYVRPEGYHAPLLYQRSAMYFPEILADTGSHVRVAYIGGFVVCRIPAPGQEAIDMEVEVEQLTDDGAFDEGFHTYLRRTNSKFVDNANTVASVASWSALNGSYDPRCRDALGVAFAAEFYADGSATGSIDKTCEVDIGAQVGHWTVAAR